jgi:predicted nucleotidyltransferase
MDFKQLEWFFDGFANGGACVLIHGSFARALATPTSDVNLYIAPYTRAELDGLWCPFNGDFETIEDFLQDLLKRPVTGSCHLVDEPRFWITVYGLAFL